MEPEAASEPDGEASFSSPSSVVRSPLSAPVVASSPASSSSGSAAEVVVFVQLPQQAVEGSAVAADGFATVALAELAGPQVEAQPDGVSMEAKELECPPSLVHEELEAAAEVRERELPAATEQAEEFEETTEQEETEEEEEEEEEEEAEQGPKAPPLPAPMLAAEEKPTVNQPLTTHPLLALTAAVAHELEVLPHAVSPDEKPQPWVYSAAHAGVDPLLVSVFDPDGLWPFLETPLLERMMHSQVGGGFCCAPRW
jgi:hypothetical protein